MCERMTERVAITLRGARPPDYDEVARIWWESWRSVGITIAQDATREELHERIPGLIEKGWHLFVAEEGSCILAMMAIIKADNHLDQLFVDPDQKGRGVGTLLLNHAKSEMSGGMWLRTAAANASAIAFYQRHGFRHERDDLHPRLKYPVVYYRWPGESLQEEN